MGIPFKFKQPYRDLFEFLSNNKDITAEILSNFCCLLRPVFPKDLIQKTISSCPLKEDQFMDFIAEGQKEVNVPFDQLMWNHVQEMIKYNLMVGLDNADAKEIRACIFPLLKMHKKEPELIEIFKKHCPTFDNGQIKSEELANIYREITSSCSMVDLLRSLLPKTRNGKSTAVKPSMASPPLPPTIAINDEPKGDAANKQTILSDVSSLTHSSPNSMSVNTPVGLGESGTSSIARRASFFQPESPLGSFNNKSVTKRVSVAIPTVLSRLSSFKTSADSTNINNNNNNNNNTTTNNTTTNNGAVESQSNTAIVIVPPKQSIVEVVREPESPFERKESSVSLVNELNVKRIDSISDFNSTAPYIELKSGCNIDPRYRSDPSTYRSGALPVMGSALKVRDDPNSLQGSKRVTTSPVVRVNFPGKYEAPVTEGCDGDTPLPLEVVEFIGQLEKQRSVLQETLENELEEISNCNSSVMLLKARLLKLEEANNAYFALAESADRGDIMSAIEEREHFRLKMGNNNDDRTMYEVAESSPFRSVYLERHHLLQRMEAWLESAKEENDFLRKEVALARQARHYDDTSAVIADILASRHNAVRGKSYDSRSECQQPQGMSNDLYPKVLHNQKSPDFSSMSPYRVAHFYNQMAKREHELNEKEEMLKRMRDLERKELKLQEELTAIQKQEEIEREIERNGYNPNSQHRRSDPRQISSHDFPEHLFYANQRPQSSSNQRETVSSRGYPPAGPIYDEKCSKRGNGQQAPRSASAKYWAATAQVTPVRGVSSTRGYGNSISASAHPCRSPLSDRGFYPVKGQRKPVFVQREGRNVQPQSYGEPMSDFDGQRQISRNIDIHIQKLLK